MAADTQVGQPAVLDRFVSAGRCVEDGSRRVGEVVVTHVGEREHPRSGSVEVVEGRDVRPQDQGILEAENERRLALLVGIDHVVGRPGDDRVVRRVCRQRANGIYLLVRSCPGHSKAFRRFGAPARPRPT